MSASEKLAALEATFEPRGLRKDVNPGIAVLVYVLPQIRALVEAAELVRRSEGLEGREVSFTESLFPTSRLAVALADLDKALL